MEDIRLIGPGEHKGAGTQGYFKHIGCQRKMKEPAPQ